MPYITIEKQNKYSHVLQELYNLGTEGLNNPGELNFLITKIIKRYIDIKGLNYTSCNDVIGVLTACKDEFYRRVVVPYENAKIIENGDVY